MAVETLLDNYYERATTPMRNTTFSHNRDGSLDIRCVEEDDEFRHLKHEIVCKDGNASSVWRQQDWGLGQNSMDVTYFGDGIVKSMSIRHTGDAIIGMKMSLTREDWLVPDPDHRLPYVFGRSDMEVWYQAKDSRLVLSRARLAFDKSTKHTFTVLDHHINKKQAIHLYRDVEYRVDLEGGIRLVIDGKIPRRVQWRDNLDSDEARVLYQYVSNRDWLAGWGPVSEIVELPG